MSSADRHAGRQRGKPFSLAARLIVWFVASAFALVLIVSGSLYWALASGLAQVEDETLLDKVHVVTSLLTAPHPDAAVITQEIGEDADAPRRTYVRLLSASGATLQETPGMAAELPAQRFPRVSHQNVSLHGVNGRPFRTLTRALPPGVARASNIIEVATDVSADEHLLARYRLDLGVVLGIALIACAGAGYQIVQAGLRPVRRMGRAAEEIGASTLDKRLEVAGLPAELRTLAVTFNAMLERLQQSFSRLRQFSDDIAHELRTPLNRLLISSEVALSQAKTLAECREALAANIDAGARLSQMVQSLLFLARSEHPAAPITRERIELDRELAAIEEFYEPLASEAGVRLSVACAEGLAAELDRSLLQRAIGNLVANAIEHTPRDGAIRIAARDMGRSLAIEVADTGCGIPADHLPHVFDRFYRADRTRGSKSGNLGLGLAIVKGIAALHGGSVAIESAAGAGTAITLHLPKQGAAPAQASA
ncbi:MAG TPA: heavy metal sensor histidine kinase [Stellaceae bacterium]|nr:heavy metal sensor histidine kinase [Stellaceae bacterium]